MIYLDRTKADQIIEKENIHLATKVMIDFVE